MTRIVFIPLSFKYVSILKFYSVELLSVMKFYTLFKIVDELPELSISDSFSFTQET
jgi:hypothetical protein